jgi:hypothetical protein
MMLNVSLSLSLSLQGKEISAEVFCASTATPVAPALKACCYNTRTCSAAPHLQCGTAGCFFGIF